MSTAAEQPEQPISRPARYAVHAAIAAVALALLSGLGNRWGLWDFQVAIIVFGLAVLSAAIAILLAGIGFYRSLRTDRSSQGHSKAATGLVLAVALLGFLAFQVKDARSYPPIHDITTDTNTPPHFVALLLAREAAPNGAEYNTANRDQQLEAYPDVLPLIIHGKNVASVVGAAEQTALDMGWEIVESAPDEGRLEATDTTFWFGYKDDVVIRVRELSQAVHVDIRSMSRVGVGDIGANANRIMAFRTALNDKLK